MSVPTIRNEIRSVLSDNPDGLTVPEICAVIGRNESEVGLALRRDDRMYIDRWTESRREPQWIAVWCMAPALVDAPKPSLSPRKYRECLEEARV